MSEIYIGSYEYQKEELWEKRLRKFQELCAETTVNAKNPGYRSSAANFPVQSSKEKNERTVYDPFSTSDPTTRKVEDLLRETEQLGKFARNYSEQHVNQEFRQKNAECFDVQIHKIEGNEEIRKKRKFSILRAERAAQLLSSKIHRSPSLENVKDCKICLKLV